MPALRDHHHAIGRRAKIVPRCMAPDDLHNTKHRVRHGTPVNRDGSAAARTRAALHFLSFRVSAIGFIAGVSLRVRSSGVHGLFCAVGGESRGKSRGKRPGGSSQVISGALLALVIVPKPRLTFRSSGSVLGDIIAA
jgi:hypothetical protein